MALKINGDVIDEAAVEQEFSSIKSYHEGLANVCCCHRNDEFREKAREEVVRWVLLNQEARRRLPKVEVDVLKEAVAQWKREQYGDMPPAEPFENGQPERGDEDESSLPAYEIALREQIAQHLRIERLVESLCTDLTPPANDEVRAYYESHLDLFMTPAQVRASHLIKSLQRAEDREAAFAELCELRERALTGEDFDKLAHEHTDREDKAVDLGYFAQEELPAEFSLCAFSMREGEISPVLVTQYGLHLVKVTGRRGAEARPFEDVRDEALALLEQARRTERVNDLVDRLREAATVEEVSEASAGA